MNHAFEEKIAPKDFVVNKRGKEIANLIGGSYPLLLSAVSYGFREWKILHL